jgi:hypothetical protein
LWITGGPGANPTPACIDKNRRIHMVGRIRQCLVAGLQVAACALAGLAGPGAGAAQMTQAAGGPASQVAQGVILPTRPCADLLQVDLADIGGAGSRVVRAAESTENNVAVCAVEGTLAPAIGFKVSLPTKSWTQRYLQLGCGGLCGSISLRAGAADGCTPLQTGGFVLAATDMGHQGMGGAFGKDPQRRADFAHRGVHVTAQAAKKLIRAFYGRAEAYSYFNGCSDGGREALVEAQRYPGDFNGIIAGAPAMNFQVQNSLYHGWQARSNTGADGKPILVASRLPLLHAAVLKQCDKLDGQADGLLADPRACHVDLAAVQCKPGADPASCLSAAEVDTVRRLYDGPRDTATGTRLTIGGPQPGSELAWAGVFVPRSAQEPIYSAIIAMDSVRNLVFEQDPPASFTLADLRFDQPTFDRLQARHRLFDATNPDLAAFNQAGGKLILWHGWSDPHISPLNTIAYHDAVERQMGRATANGFERLYLLPGVYHCEGGEGPSSIDLLTPMLEWVERGVAPQGVVARTAAPKPSFVPPPQLAGEMAANQPDGAAAAGRPPLPPAPGAAGQEPATPPEPPRSRPVFPYPAVAVFNGKGDPSNAPPYGG